MALQTSGPISFAQIQDEFGGSNPISISEYYAGGANVPSGATGTSGAIPSSGTISINKFYGSFDNDTQIVTVGFKRGDYYGYIVSDIGSISDGTSNFYGGAAIHILTFDTLGGVTYNVSGNHPNSGWTTMNINGTSYPRTSATYGYISSTNRSSWRWPMTYSSFNPLGTTVGAQKTVIFS